MELGIWIEDDVNVTVRMKRDDSKGGNGEGDTL